MMRGVVPTAVTCAVALVSHAVHAHADPAAPQLTPLHGQREDAQLLTNQLRTLDHEQPAPAPPVRAAPAIPAETVVHRDPALMGAGVVLLGISGVAALGTLTLYAAAPPDNSLTSDSWDSTKTFFLTTSVLTGLAGLGLILASRSVQIAPTATSKSVGLAISGRL